MDARSLSSRSSDGEAFQSFCLNEWSSFCEEDERCRGNNVKPKWQQHKKGLVDDWRVETGMSHTVLNYNVELERDAVG